jgi:hypothetical protein
MNIISSFDFHGISPKITIRGNSKHKTLFGGLLSIYVASLFLAGSLYFLIQLFSRMNYSVLVSDEFHPNSFSNWTNAEVSTILVNKLGEFIEDADRLYTVIGVTATIKSTILRRNK